MSLGKQSSPRRSKARLALTILNMLIIVGLIGSTVYYRSKYYDQKKLSGLTEAETNKALLEKVDKVYDLPEGEEPVIIIVKDAQNLQTDFEKQIGQIFKNLQNNDAIFIYKKAKLGIQFRESSNKVVATTTITVPIVTQVVSVSDSASTATIDGLKQLFGSQLNLAKKVDASLEASKTVVVDVSKNYPAEAKSIAEQLKAEVATDLPADFRADDGVEIVVLVAPSIPISETP